MKELQRIETADIVKDSSVSMMTNDALEDNASQILDDPEEELSSADRLRQGSIISTHSNNTITTDIGNKLSLFSY